MKSFLICPVRGYDVKLTEKHMKALEEQGYTVHWPPRDTDQNDTTGLRICLDNLQAISRADVVHFVWDGKSEGCLFDLGMAFAMEKEIIPLEMPNKTEGKSFQNMVEAYKAYVERMGA